MVECCCLPPPPHKCTCAHHRATGLLAHFKVPKFFHFTNEFPVTVTGKVRKVEMREMAKKILEVQDAKRR